MASVFDVERVLAMRHWRWFKRTNGGRGESLTAFAQRMVALVMMGMIVGPAVGAQHQGPSGTFTLKVQSDIVLTNVVVRDKKTGEVVKGLKASDFTILENGKPQKIASFDYQNVDEAAVLREKSTVNGKATIADLVNGEFAGNPAALR